MNKAITSSYNYLTARNLLIRITLTDFTVKLQNLFFILFKCSMRLSFVILKTYKHLFVQTSDTICTSGFHFRALCHRSNQLSFLSQYSKVFVNGTIKYLQILATYECGMKCLNKKYILLWCT